MGAAEKQCNTHHKSKIWKYAKTGTESNAHKQDGNCQRLMFYKNTQSKESWRHTRTYGIKCSHRDERGNMEIKRKMSTNKDQENTGYLNTSYCKYNLCNKRKMQKQTY